MVHALELNELQPKVAGHIHRIGINGSGEKFDLIVGAHIDKAVIELPLHPKQDIGVEMAASGLLGSARPSMRTE